MLTGPAWNVYARVFTGAIVNSPVSQLFSQCLRDSADVFVYYVRQLTTHSRTAGSARCSVNGHELTRKTRHLAKAVLQGSNRNCPTLAAVVQYITHSSCQILSAETRRESLLWWKHHTWLERRRKLSRARSQRTTAESRVACVGRQRPGDGGHACAPRPHRTTSSIDRRRLLPTFHILN